MKRLLMSLCTIICIISSQSLVYAGQASVNFTSADATPALVPVPVTVTEDEADDVYSVDILWSDTEFSGEAQWNMTESKNEITWSEDDKTAKVSVTNNSNIDVNIRYEANNAEDGTVAGFTMEYTHKMNGSTTTGNTIDIPDVYDAEPVTAETTLTIDKGYVKGAGEIIGYIPLTITISDVQPEPQP